MLVPDNCSAREDSPVCNPREYYLSVYSILLGDWGGFSREGDFENKEHALVVFVGFSFGIAIVLLSVLIAIIGFSYERCLERSEHLLGRSRISLLAELVAFRNARTKFDPKKYREFIENIDWKNRATAAKVCLTSIIVIGWIVAEFIGSMANSDKSPFVRIVIALSTIAGNCILFAVFMFFLSQETDNGNDNYWGNVQGKFSHIVTWLMTLLLGEGRNNKPRILSEAEKVSVAVKSEAEKMSAAVKQFEALVLEHKQLHKNIIRDNRRRQDARKRGSDDRSEI